jgi:hypothetical protein
MRSTARLFRWTAILTVSLALTPVTEPSLTAAPRFGDFRHAPPAPASPIVVAQFSPCPNGKCR